MKVIAVADDAHQQRNFKSNQDAQNDHDQIKEELEALGEGEGQKKKAGREAAHHSHNQFNPDKAVGQPAPDKAGEKAANAHGEEIAADDGGELKDAVTNQIAGYSASDQLVDQAAGGNQQNGYEE